MQGVVNWLNQSYSWKNLGLLFLAAVLVRGLTFGLYIQHNERYYQSDTRDYHNCAYCVSQGHGMSLPSGRPIFWRTPGYPVFLAPFYACFGAMPEFSQNRSAHIWVIILQILLCSLIPIFIFFLALNLTRSLPIAWLSGIVSVVHLGFVLSSCYIMSDGLALIFFVLFLYFLYKSFNLYKEGECKTTNAYWYIGLAALNLAAYTWIRPNGQFVIAVASILLLASACSWLIKFKKIILFTLISFGLLAGWMVRNERLTGEYFFCSMSGPIMMAFMLPKVMRDLTGEDLELCWKASMVRMKRALTEETIRLNKEQPHLVVSRELVCKKLAWPQIKKHPFWLGYEWIKEANKATFDLYSSQLVEIAEGSQGTDPLEEHLTEKISDALWKKPIPWGTRLIAWLEFLWLLIKWIGLFAGAWFFLAVPLIKRFNVSAYQERMFYVWLKVGFMAGSLLAMTGGFGYARLRLPVDPLLIILTITFWYWIYTNKEQRDHATTITSSELGYN